MIRSCRSPLIAFWIKDSTWRWPSRCSVISTHCNAGPMYSPFVSRIAIQVRLNSKEPTLIMEVKGKRSGLLMIER
ncbi:Uncharacterised protein [Vibrio cholerae]|nr:Uncharacterised protein [Vibrio cholerae]